MSESTATALEVGHKLIAEALWHDNSCTWIGAEDTAPSRAGGGRGLARSRLLGSTLYEGTSGVALVLAAMGRYTGEPAFARTARGAVQYGIRVGGRQSAVGRVGLYEGISGLLYAASTCSVLLHDEFFADVCASLLVDYGSPRGSDEHDLVAGASGAVLALLTVYDTLQLNDALDLAIQYGNLLLAEVEKRDLAFLSGSSQSGASYGFAHGAAGEMYALLRLARATEEGRFISGSATLEEILVRGYDPERACWPDTRGIRSKASKGHGGDVYWCYGSTGIAIALQAVNGRVGALGSRALRYVAAAASELAEDPTVNLGLCHGIAGCLDVLIDAGTTSGAQAAARVLSGRLTQELREALIPPELSVRSLGLMTGMPGVALACLRVEAPELPSPLALRSEQGPKMTSQ